MLIPARTLAGTYISPVCLVTASLYGPTVGMDASLGANFRLDLTIAAQMTPEDLAPWPKPPDGAPLPGYDDSTGAFLWRYSTGSGYSAVTDGVEMTATYRGDYDVGRGTGTHGSFTVSFEVPITCTRGQGVAGGKAEAYLTTFQNTEGDGRRFLVSWQARASGDGSGRIDSVTAGIDLVQLQRPAGNSWQFWNETQRSWDPVT